MKRQLCSYIVCIYNLLGVATAACAVYWDFQYLCSWDVTLLWCSICSATVSIGLFLLISSELKKLHRNVVPMMTYEEFLDTCNLHSGNWSETLLDGIRKRYPAKYEDVAVRCHNIAAQHGDIQGVQFLCSWLKDQGVVFRQCNK